MSNNSKDVSASTEDQSSDLSKPDVNQNQAESVKSSTVEASQVNKPQADQHAIRKKEVGGPKGLEPTRYGDWESKGRCYDF